MHAHVCACACERVHTHFSFPCVFYTQHTIHSAIVEREKKKKKKKRVFREVISYGNPDELWSFMFLPPPAPVSHTSCPRPESQLTGDETNKQSVPRWAEVDSSRSAACRSLWWTLGHTKQSWWAVSGSNVQWSAVLEPTRIRLLCPRPDLWGYWEVRPQWEVKNGNVARDSLQWLSSFHIVFCISQVYCVYWHLIGHISPIPLSDINRCWIVHTIVWIGYNC